MADVCTEYAGALFELAVEESLDSQLLDELRGLREILTADGGEYLRLLSTPVITKAEKLELADEAFASAHRYVRSFIKLLVERGYADYLPACADEYERLYYERNNIVIAEVESATELSTAQSEALAAKLESVTHKKVELRVTVNPKILGGLLVKIDGRVYDGSLANKFESIRTALADMTIGEEEKPQ